MKNKTRNGILKIYSASEAEASASLLSAAQVDQKRRDENRNLATVSALLRRPKGRRSRYEKSAALFVRALDADAFAVKPWTASG